MATALAASFQAGTTTDPARVLLSVTGATGPTIAYASNFTSTVDGWTGSTVALTANFGGTGKLRLSAGSGTYTASASRTVTGLTIGSVYTYSLLVDRSGQGTCALGVTGMAPTAYMLLPAGTPTAMSYTFTATATSHVITFLISQTLGGTDFRLRDVSLITRTGYLGHTIARTDANGTAPVRLAPLQDVAGAAGSATMTVTDYEAALTGTVAYTLTTGAGATVNASVVNSGAPGVWLTLPALADPATPTPPPFVQLAMVTGWDESAKSNGSLHTIVGRADPIANPGPLALRAGSLVLLCADYATARAVRLLVDDGDVALLRQPTFPGGDLYLVATEVAVAPAQANAPVQMWNATVRYQEVLEP